MALTARQQRFVEEYLLDCNAAAAYRRAGYKASSNQIAAVNSSRLMANDKIREAIEMAQQHRAEQTGITSEWVLRRLKEEADYRGDDATHSARVKALELCGKHLALFVDRQQVEGTQELTVRLRRVVENDRSNLSDTGPGPAPGTNGFHSE